MTCRYAGSDRENFVCTSINTPEKWTSNLEEFNIVSDVVTMSANNSVQNSFANSHRLTKLSMFIHYLFLPRVRCFSACITIFSSVFRPFLLRT